jgi:NNP family nitrate/nitrite transporter-like MFS transporter
VGRCWILGGSAQTHVDRASTTPIWVQNAGFIWVPFIASPLRSPPGLAWTTSPAVKAGFAEQVAIFKHKHQWLMSWLYTGTFGSFIGLAVGPSRCWSTPRFRPLTPSNCLRRPAVRRRFVRPIGGWLADRIGGAIITCWVFVAMAVASLGARFLPGLNGGDGNMSGFVIMYPDAVRRRRHRQRLHLPHDSDHLPHPARAAGTRQRPCGAGRGVATGDTEAAATLGFSSAVAAFGGFFIPIAYGASINLTGGYQAALMVFALFYLSCLWVTWRWYAGKNVEAPC